MVSETNSIKKKYSKAQILKSKQFKNTDKYLLEAVLKENEQYTLIDVKKILSKEKKRGVK